MKVSQRLRAWAEAFRESLLFVPALMIAGSILVAFAAAWIDAHVDNLENVPFVMTSSAISARTVLATVAGATVTVAGIVFAMTSVTVQLAASNYSPRVIRGFQRDRFQQVVIGAAAGTFTYCLLALSSVRTPSADAAEALPEPRLTVTLGVVFGVATIVAIVAYIDHIVRLMRVDNVLRRITSDTLASIDNSIPLEADPRALGESSTPDGDRVSILAETSGWVRTIDAGRMANDLADNATVRLDVTVGSFVTEGFPLASFWQVGDAPERTIAVVRRNIEIGPSRTMDQDPLFGITLLSDVALRALSTGINDPTTAETVVQHLLGPISQVFTRPMRPIVNRGNAGQVVFEPRRHDDVDYVTAGFGRIRANADRQPQVLEALLEVLCDLIDLLTDRPESHGVEALRAEVAMVVRAIDALEEPERTRLLDVAVRRGVGPAG